jgi:hypothetical protein
MKRYYKLVQVPVLLILFLNQINGQDEEYLNGKLYLSPEFGLIIGTTTRIEVSPAVGYYVSDRFSIAGGFRYEYYKQSDNYYGKYETNIYGPRAFARYSLIKNIGNLLPVQSNIEILAHVEFEALSLSNKYFGNNLSNEVGRFWYSTVLIGGGISQSASQRIKLNAIILWDVDTSLRSPYTNPIFRIAIQIMLGKMDVL